MKGKLMENMIWIDIKKEINRIPFILVPLGPKSKEHGLHLPMNTDYIMAEYFRDKMLEKYDVLSTSTIDINYFPAFTEYSGSEHLSLETAIELVYQKCKCHVNHGVTHIYVINMGISTNKVLEKVQQRFQQENIVFNFTNQKKYDSIAEIVNIQQQQRGTHADELETSMMLCIKPEVVNLEKAMKDDNDEIDANNPGPLTLNPNASCGVYSPTGAWGDPSLASVEKGEIVIKKYIELMQEEINVMIFDCLRQKHKKEQSMENADTIHHELELPTKNEQFSQ